MNAMGFASTLLTGLAGLLLGSTLAWVVLVRRSALRHARLVNTAREQLVAGTQQLRAANARLQADLEKERVAARQHLVAASAEQRASIARLEGQLRFAYAEIDRLNAAAGVSTADSQVDGHGFALTRPYAR